MEKCIFIGYLEGYNLTIKQTIILEQAKFDERYFLGLKQDSLTLEPFELLLPVLYTPVLDFRGMTIQMHQKRIQCRKSVLSLQNRSLMLLNVGNNRGNLCIIVFIFALLHFGLHLLCYRSTNGQVTTLWTIQVVHRPLVIVYKV